MTHLENETTRANKTEERRMDASLQENIRLLNLIFDKADVHLVYLDRDFNFLMVNAAYAATCKKTPQELLGRNHFEFYPHEENEKIFKQVRDSGRAVSFKDKPFEFPDQPERGVTYWDWTLSPVPDSQGEVQGLVFSLTETTDRKKMEQEKDAALQALGEREFQYHRLADAGPALIWTSGTDKLCTYFNEPWLKFTGRTLEQEIGDGWAQGVHPDDLDRCIRTYNDAFDRRLPFDMEYRLKSAAGDYRWIRDLGTPNYDSKGEFLGYIGHCFDITHQKEAAEAVEKLNRDLEQKVNERTRELQDTVNNLEELNRVFVGRELKMAELKARIAELEKLKDAPK